MQNNPTPTTNRCCELCRCKNFTKDHQFVRGEQHVCDDATCPCHSQKGEREANGAEVDWRHESVTHKMDVPAMMKAAEELRPYLLKGERIEELPLIPRSLNGEPTRSRFDTIEEKINEIIRRLNNEA